MAGQQILLKSGNRKAWWFGKVIWNILSVLGFYLVLYLSVTAVSIVTGGFKAAQPEVAAFLLENQKIENAGTELYMYAMAVPVIVSLAIAVTQMMIAVVFQPPMGYIWVCAVIAAGIFIYSPYSPKLSDADAHTGTSAWKYLKYFMGSGAWQSVDTGFGGYWQYHNREEGYLFIK